MNEVMERPAMAVEITPEQLALIKKTVAKDATDDELQLYFYDCKRRGAHPLDKKIHFTKRGGKYVPIVGIDFLREQAAKTGECMGISDPIFSGVPQKPDFAATVTVKRLVQGHVAEFTATARWSEYCPTQGQDHMWKKMPHTMLGKCAEALALRKSFPGDEMGGLYIHEEMDQAKEASNPTTKAMYQDFPPGELLRGTLLRLVPPQGAEPAGAVIQMANEGLSATYIVYGDEQRYAPLVGCEVEYRYEKKPGAKWILTELYLAPKPAVRQAIEVQAPIAAQAQAVDDAQDLPIDQAALNAYAARFKKGMVLDAQEKESKRGPYYRLNIGGVWGSVWHSPGHFGFDSFEELADTDVFYTTSEAPGKNGGKPFITFEEIVPEDVFEQYVISKISEMEA